MTKRQCAILVLFHSLVLCKALHNLRIRLEGVHRERDREREREGERAESTSILAPSHLSRHLARYRAKALGTRTLPFVICYPFPFVPLASTELISLTLPNPAPSSLHLQIPSAVKAHYTPLSTRVPVMAKKLSRPIIRRERSHVRLMCLLTPLLPLPASC